MHHTFFRLLASLLLVGFALSAVVSAQPSATNRAASDRDPAVVARLADDWRAGANIPGLSAAIVQGDQVVWTQGFGLADAEQLTPARPETVFRIASISKPITAVAVMQLVERGLVALEDPIQKFVPSFPRKPQGEIRIRHLLTHTSGIRHYRGSEFSLAESFPTLDRAIGVFRQDPLEFAPGERYLYSTYGYNLLQGVVESVTGQTFNDYLRAAIFTPAGMSATYLERPQELVRHRARQYVRGPSPLSWLNAPYVDLSVKWAGGGLIASAGDIARFDIALNHGKLLRADTLEKMYTSGRLNDGSATGYGLGWMVRQQGNRQFIAHSGGAMGGTTYFIREPKTRLAAVVLTNLDNVARLGDLAEQLMTLAPRPLPVSTR